MKKIHNFKLTDVTISGYKSISTDQPIHLVLRDTNILIGANGAGKSNIISFFKMMSFMMSKSFSRYVETNGTSSHLLHFGPKHTKEITAHLTFSDGSDIDDYSFALAPSMSDRLIIATENIEWHKNGQQQPYRQELEPNFKESALCTSDKKVAKMIYKMLAGCKVYQFHDSSATSSLRQRCPVETVEYLQAEAGNLPSFLFYLKDHFPKAYYRITTYVADVVPQFREFYLEPVDTNISLRWKDNSATDYVFSSYQFSDGSMRFIALATLLLQPEKTMPATIILDEPELGLHPYAISQLAEMIKEASLHAQVIIATQSKDLIDYFNMQDITIVEIDNSTQATTVRKLNEEDLKHWLSEYSLSELWDKNIIGGQP